MEWRYGYMKKLIHDIHNGKNLEENLIRYRDLAVPVYNEYAALELTFSAYTLAQEVAEEKTELADREKETVAPVLQALKELSGEGADYGKTAENMQKIRAEITSKMDLFTAYTDRLIIYEYVLNRMELKFLPEKELVKQLSEVDEEQFLKNLMVYLFSEKDQSIVRDKLRLVIGQIPVHMTKSKWFERIGDALTLYKGGDRSALDDFIYMIRTSAMVYKPAREPGGYPQIEHILDTFAAEDFIETTKERYEELTAMLEEGARSIHEITDFYYSLQKVVNGIYAVCLCFPYAKEKSRLMKACESIWLCLSSLNYQDEMLVPLEGRIEPYVEKTSYLESVLYEIKTAYKEEVESLSLTGFFEDFALVANLLSDSLFIDLDKVQKAEKADDDYVRQCTMDLMDELDAGLKQVSRPVRRAVMGQVIEKLPMLFEKTEEVEDYIRINLLGCQDKAEKLIVMSILSDLARGGM